MENKKNVGRRDFLRAAAVTGVAAAVARPGRILGANDRVNVAIVGPGGRGRRLMRAFNELAGKQNMEMVAVCDIWNRPRERAAGMVQEWTGKAPVQVRNTDELYSRNDVDAVLIATADFQHAYHCVEAVEAGKDVYVEKPLANTMEDAKKVLRVVSSSDRVVQNGTQRRSADNYIQAADFIQKGKFGDVKFVDISWNVNQPQRWRRPKEVAEIRKEDTDWERFLIDRPYIPWDPRKYLEFRLFWPFSSGIPDQWLVHQIDTVHWLTGDPYPESAVALGGLFSWKDGRENPDTLTIVFNYAKGFQVLYTSRQTNSYGGVKEVFCSNSGTIDLERNVISGEGGLQARHSLEGQARMLEEQKLESTTQVATDVDATGDSTTQHMANWMDCIRSRRQPTAGIESGYSHSVALCMAIEAQHTGRRVTFDRSGHEIKLA